MNTDVSNVNVKMDTFVDKNTWGEGPWQHEADRYEWRDVDTDLPCIVRRGTSGALCGYVGVGVEHCAFGRSPDALETVEVHGGLTYGEPCQTGKEFGICHVGDEDDERWWFGFDCAHCMDVMPGTEARLRALGHEHQSFGETYRDVAYVMQEVHCLAEQLYYMPGC